ncbi:MAG: hydrogen gas-evolving membrane-bound hydrogenase subunit E [Spirochaetaceae bacterium]
MKLNGAQHAAVIAVAVILFGLLSYTFLQMPVAGVGTNPAQNEVRRRYLSSTQTDTNAPNVVNSIVTDYRAFDTLGEAAVLFVGVTSVASILISNRKRESDE